MELVTSSLSFHTLVCFYIYLFNFVYQLKYILTSNTSKLITYTRLIPLSSCILAAVAHHTMISDNQPKLEAEHNLFKEFDTYVDLYGKL